MTRKRQTSTPGLKVVRHSRFGYQIIHTGSGLPANYGLITLLRDAVAGADAVGRLGVDFTLPPRKLDAALDRDVEGGSHEVYRYLSSLRDCHPMPRNPLPPPVRRAKNRGVRVTFR
jgi:hypothetical protein